jgi:tetratricopeptide (TPR) repeat protein
VNPTSNDRIPARLLIAVLLVATFVVYAGTLGFDFVHDDHEQIVQNYRIQSWKFATLYFTQQVWGQISPHDPSNYYRPVFLLWLRSNHALFGVKPWGWHFTTVLLHLAVTLLVYCMASRLLGNNFVAFVAALIFGIHPIHLESVAWVSGVTDPLLGVLFLSAFIAYLKQRDLGAEQGGWAAASLALYTLALLTKETAVTLPILLIGWEMIVVPTHPTVVTPGSRRERLTQLIISLAPYALVTAVYLAVRREVLGEFGHTYTSLPFRTVILTVPSLLWFYLRHLVWPVGLSDFYDLPYVTDLSPAPLLLPVAALLGLVAAVVWWAKTFLEPRQRRDLAFAALWTLVPLLPVLNPRFFPESDIVHDRYLYLPSIGFAMLSALAICKLAGGWPARWGHRRLQLATVAALALALGLGTVSQSLAWADDLLLAYRGVQVAPRSYYAANILANAFAQRGNLEEAIQLYQKVFALNPNYWVSHYNLALVYFKMGQLENSERQLTWAIKVNPFDWRAYVLLGLARFESGHADEAASLMRHAIELRPDLADAHMGLGMALEAQGKLEGALEQFQTALALDPGRSAARRKAAELAAHLAAGSSPAASGSLNRSLDAPPLVP